MITKSQILVSSAPTICHCMIIPVLVLFLRGVNSPTSIAPILLIKKTKLTRIAMQSNAFVWPRLVLLLVTRGQGNCVNSQYRIKTRSCGQKVVFTILHESLGMRKLFSKWVPRLLTPNKKQQRVEDSERCLELFKRGKKDFMCHRRANLF